MEKVVQTLRRTVLPIILLVVLVVLGTRVFQVVSMPTNSSMNMNAPSPLIGRIAPNFRLETLNGGYVDLQGLRGKAVVLNFWASWCIPCRDEAPLLRAAQEKYGKKNLIVVGSIYNDTPQKAQAFVTEFALAYPNLIDPNGKNAVSYGVTGLPETYFINQFGVIVSKKIGPLEATDFEKRINQVLQSTQKVGGS